MIFCFSGTGNSRYAARLIAEYTADEIVDLNELIRSDIERNDGGVHGFASEKPYVVVCPTYCWNIPVVVENFLKRCDLAGSDKMYFCLTCGSDTGAAAKGAEKLCKEKKMRFMGLGAVIMPENYIAMFDSPTYDDAKGIISCARPAIESMGRKIAQGQPMVELDIPGNPAKSKLKPFFYKHSVKDKKFMTTDACTGCGLCERVCPMANIVLGDKGPEWQGRCTHCMACISRCPTKAIEYGKISLGKRRYYLDDNGEQRR